MAFSSGGKGETVLHQTLPFTGEEPEVTGLIGGQQIVVAPGMRAPSEDSLSSAPLTHPVPLFPHYARVGAITICQELVISTF